MASDALLSLLPFVGGGNQPVSASNPATLSSTTAPTSAGLGANSGTGINAANYLDLKTVQGTRKGHALVAYILYDQAETVGTSSTGTLLFTVDHADDNGSGAPGTWQLYGANDEGVIALGTTAQNGIAHVTLSRTKRYVRLNAFLSVSGSGSPTVSVPVIRADVRETDP